MTSNEETMDNERDPKEYYLKFPENVTNIQLCVMIKAGMGSGKTYSLSKLFRSSFPSRTKEQKHTATDS